VVVLELQPPILGPQQPVAIVERKTVFPLNSPVACLQPGSADSRVGRESRQVGLHCKPLLELWVGGLLIRGL